MIALSRMKEATMFCIQMTVSLRAHIKTLHTNPADVSSTRLLHMIAAFRFLDSGPTFGAFLRPLLFLPLLESGVAKLSALVLFACEAFMGDGSAFGADCGETC